MNDSPPRRMPGDRSRYVSRGRLCRRELGVVARRTRIAVLVALRQIGERIRGYWSETSTLPKDLILGRHHSYRQHLLRDLQELKEEHAAQDGS